MAWTTGTVDTFTNKLINTPEVADQGNGSQTIFTLQTGLSPVFISGVKIEFTIGTVTKQATSDASGDFSGHADITSGTIAEDGSLPITFATAPDNLTDILFNEYTTKGVLEKVKEYITGNQFEETIGTGNDVLTNFNYTPLNGPIAKGQIRVRFRILGTWYWVWDNGLGEFIHDKISASTIDYTATPNIDITFTDPIENTFIIEMLYTDATVEGRDWLIMHENLSQDNAASDAFPGLILKEYIFRNSGSNYIEDVFFGVRESQYIPSNQYLHELNLYKQFEESEWQSSDWNINAFSTSYSATQEHWSIHPSSALNDATMTYWILATKHIVFVCIKVSGTVYTNWIAGNGTRFSSKDNYPNPNFIIGNFSGNFQFTSTSASHSMVADPPATNNAWGITKENEYVQIGSNLSKMLLEPTSSYVSSGDVEKTTNSKVVLYELFFCRSTPNFELMFQMPDVYHCPYIDMATEDEITEGANTYKVFQNIFRTSSFDYFAVKTD